MYKRDKAFRPIFVINMKKFKSQKIDTETMIGLTNYVMQFIITRCLIPGKIENWVTIIDMKGVGLTDIPKKLMKALAKPMQTYFKARLYRLHVVNSQWVVKIMWKLAKKWVDPLTIKKFVICGDDCAKELNKLIEPDHLEKRFGGTLPDKNDQFFPPDLR